MVGDLGQQVAGAAPAAAGVVEGKRLGLPAGPRVGHARLVSSMLPDDVDLSSNLMWPEAVAAAENALLALTTEGRPGLIQEERLRRNLLSSQPLCFNLFGYLGAHEQSLLPWVRTIQPEAASIDDVRLEWAPATGTLGGSAFDAFVSYETGAGNSGFVGVEVKYAEDLAAAQRKPANDKYKAPTLTGSWKTGAVERLDKPKLRQFWYNQLLTQVVLASGEYDEGFGAVVACAADHSAREVTATVSCRADRPGCASLLLDRGRRRVRARPRRLADQVHRALPDLRTAGRMTRQLDSSVAAEAPMPVPTA